MLATLLVPPPAATPVVKLPHVTVGEYLDFESTSPVRHYYYQGKVIEMAGGSPAHNKIVNSISRLLGTGLLPADCDVMTSDMKVAVSTELFYYPDLVVVCGDLFVAPGNVLQNPVLLGEVLSPSTEAFDLGRKFQLYRMIPSLEHILFAEQERPGVEHWARENGTWKLSSYSTNLTQTVSLSICGTEIALPLEEVYRRITFAPTIQDSETVTEESRMEGTV